MIFSIFITGDDVITIYINTIKRKPKDLLKLIRAVEDFQLTSKLTWLSRIDKDNYVWLMPAVNAFVDKDIVDLRADLTVVNENFNKGLYRAELSDLILHNMAGFVTKFQIKEGKIIETPMTIKAQT